VILAGDIGGTKTALALFDDARGTEPLTELRRARYPSADHAGLEEIVRAFLADGPERPRVACFGVAGPVADGRARITNLPWLIDAAELAASFGFAEVELLNDLQAAAYGVMTLPRASMKVLQPAAPVRGNVAVIAPGTGLGEALLYWDGERHHAIASEGGHADFAPQTDREIRLLVYLRTRLAGHVSWERVLSGDGLGQIYDFLRDVEGLAESPDLALALQAAEDRNAAIAEAGLATGDGLASEALAMFVTLLGAEAGNLALKGYARGGVVLAGGIPPRILPALSDGRFIRGFTDKGRFCGFLSGLEVRVALDTRAPLLGAANHIRRRA
jgi:glucokinase